MTITRAAVVAEARTWIGTPYHHQARVKGVGVDCAGVLIGVARALGIVAADFDISGYTREADGHSLLEWCDANMRRLPGQQFMQPGHAVVVAFDKHPQHLGVVVDYPAPGVLAMVHATAVVSSGRPRVLETRLVFGRSMRFVAAYRLPGVED